MAFISGISVAVSKAQGASLRCAVRPAGVSSFVGARVFAPVAVRAAKSAGPRMEFEVSEGVKYPLDLSIVALALFGWIVPSSLPAGIPLTEGTGLTQAFLASMQQNLAAFPKGPAADDPFWTLCTLWHVG